jgi:hypothetical protein
MNTTTLDRDDDHNPHPRYRERLEMYAEVQDCDPEQPDRDETEPLHYERD